MSWTASVSFSERMSNVMQISIVLVQASPNSTQASAQSEATSIEIRAYNDSESKEVYQQTCDDIIKSLGATSTAIMASSKTNNDQPDWDSDVENDTTISIDNYHLARYHRNGLFSTVYKSRAPVEAPSTAFEGFKPNAVVALKVTVPSQMGPPHDSQREAKIIRQAQGKGTIALWDTFALSDGKFVLVFPFMSYDLETIVSQKLLHKQQIIPFLRDMFEGLAHIHDQGILHRDIKPSNILIRSLTGPAFLADFGIAWSAKHHGSEPADEKITDVGTTSYRAPELLFGNRAYTTAIDLWAAGCVVAEVVNETTHPLFDSGALGAEFALISSIFKSLGTPNLQVWPEAARFPDWGKMQFFEFAQKSWSDLLPGASDAERDLVSRLVRYESGERIVASTALTHLALQKLS